MRIIFINRFFSPDHSATSQMVSDLAFYLAQQGHAVNVITSRQSYDAPDARLDRYENINGVEVQRWISSIWSSGSRRQAGRGIDPVPNICLRLSDSGWRRWGWPCAGG